MRLINEPTPTEELLLGRRALDGVPEVELLGDLSWSPDEECWVLLLRLRADTAGSAIPEWTEWYVLVDKDYPFGDISFHPSKRNGLLGTYPHQRLNREEQAKRPWRSGKLCLQADLTGLGFRARHEEPTEAWERLAWHARRARRWLEAAASDRLRVQGDLFELPELPFWGVQQIAFREGSTSFTTWSGIPDDLGWVDLVPVPGTPRVLAVHAFNSLDGQRLFAPTWGDMLSRASRKQFLRALWMRSPALPVLPPYAPPTDWSELQEAAQRAGWNLVERLQTVVPQLRNGNHHLCLLGFPVPARIGAKDARMHWWALRLPVFAHGNTAARGYRRNERGYWHYDKAHLFKHSRSLEWLRTDNWDPDELRSRGALPQTLRELRVLLVGAGALGSSLAELLVRGGVSRLVIVEPDVLEAGNLVRHSLDFTSVGYSKAYALAEHLCSVSPDLEVRALSESLDVVSSKRHGLIDQCDVVVDCTGSDEVIRTLGKLNWGGQRTFSSASFGFGARRLLYFSARGSSFPEAAFWQLTEEWTRREYQELQSAELPRAGVGCWHPIFPARADDVWLAAIIAVKALEQAIVGSPKARLDVYEREEVEGSFLGVRHVAAAEEHPGP